MLWTKYIGFCFLDFYSNAVKFVCRKDAGPMK